ncbi:hypothetical protein D0Z07_8559 [Hyphodiscus hymeniophilus]|uniref:Uncharacterized protein n=1 Tax=Hyphodiscus hymeniophilus TaxID=353542 RepID=A0A9P6SNA8_9HELO|nr:hypothetical protein D0Z07_8559 [Hyphodiscus hymeniophilus]
MDKLSADLQHVCLLPHPARALHVLTYTERDALLEQVKVYGREPTNADPIFTKQASRTESLILCCRN